MKFGIRVMPKKQLLDVQGRTVEQFLKEKSFPVSGLRIGKFIELEIDSADEKEASELLRRAMESGLYNPLTEQYEIQNTAKKSAG